MRALRPRATPAADGVGVGSGSGSGSGVGSGVGAGVAAGAGDTIGNRSTAAGSDEAGTVAAPVAPAVQVPDGLAVTVTKRADALRGAGDDKVEGCLIELSVALRSLSASLAAEEELAGFLNKYD